MSTPDFRLKGSTVTVVVLDLNHFEPDAFSRQLAERMAQAPELLQGSPVVLGLEQFAGDQAALDFDLLLEHCRTAGMRPVAFRGLDPAGAERAAATGLALLPSIPARERQVGAGGRQDANRDTGDGVERGSGTRHRPTRTIVRPVRSGQQIYAEGGDLIVLSQVSEGAEVIADGNIHIYGALRGRALAGVHGDSSARIFCQQLDPELISVAGHFLLSDAISDSILGKPARVSLDGDVLDITAL